MRISLCIPAYGREPMLAQTLYSVLMQTYQDFEIIVRDDNPDFPVCENPAIKKLFEYIGSRLQYFIEPHLGTYSRVANATLEHATGDVLGMLASDDLLAPAALHTINDAFETEKFGAAHWIYGKTVSVDEHLRYLGIDGAKTTLAALKEQNSIGCPSTFWNRQMMNMVGKFDTRYKWAADYDLWIRFWKQREPVFLEQPIGIFRHHARQMSTEHAAEIESEAKTISWRHSSMGDVISRAHCKWITRQAYGGEDMPRANDDLGQHAF